MKKILLIILASIIISTSVVGTFGAEEADKNASDELDLTPSCIIPNAKVAYSVGKILLENKVGRSLEYEGNYGTYYLDVRYRAVNNTWVISQECDMKYGGYGGSGSSTPFIALDKDTGEVKYIFEDTLDPHWEWTGKPIQEYYFIEYIKKYLKKRNKNMEDLWGYSTFD